MKNDFQEPGRKGLFYHLDLMGIIIMNGPLNNSIPLNHLPKLGLIEPLSVTLVFAKVDYGGGLPWERNP